MYIYTFKSHPVMCFVKINNEESIVSYLLETFRSPLQKLL